MTSETANQATMTHAEVEQGNHFAAWQQPQLFSEEVRAAFRSLG